MRRAGAAAVARVLRGEWPHAEERAEEAWRLACGEDDAPVAERPLAKQVTKQVKPGASSEPSAAP